DISVFTPAGDQITLPRGATVLDFAYAVHTQVGERASSALVNKRPASLLSELKNGDLVRIITAKEPIYHCTWVDAVKTSRAKSHMRAMCNKKRKEIDRMSAINILSATLGTGSDEIVEWISRQSIADQIFRVPRDLSFYREILHRYVADKRQKSILPTIFRRPVRKLKEYRFENFVIYSAESISSVEFDYCCHPKRGDPIVAFKIGSKAVVHHKFCEKANSLIEKGVPMLFVEWSESKVQKYRLLVTLKDEKGALAKLLAYLAKIECNIISIKLGEGTSQSNLCEVIFESRDHDQAHLKELLERKFKVLELVSKSDAYKQQ
ncbi:MAG: TGS domain-containing protein, partial [Hydrogenimonas sp.]|nr:TGS domain-containing protein [Hydrogenimonas sp.]